MANIADILVGLEKRIIVLERLAGVEPAAATLVHPKSRKQDDFRVAEAVRKVAEIERAKGIIK